MSKNELKLSTDSKIDWLQKSITRTDSYLNSANTKSTIMLTFSMALSTAICVNSTDIIKCGFAYQLTIATSIFLLLISSIYSLLAIRPFLTPSEKTNLLSFVDIADKYNSANEYENRINTATDSEMICEMSSLNYNLSKGLIKKYKLQKKSVDLIILSLITMAITLFFYTN